MVVSDKPLSFDGARAACAARRGALVEIDDATEDAHVRCLLGKHLATWIGLSSGARGAPWRWESGRVAAAPGAPADGVYSNWVRNHTSPRLWVEARQCAHAAGAGWSAADRACRAPLPYVCEFGGGGG